MSFSTTCPACGATFKVVPDQLKVSRGWVRCGSCDEIFDALRQSIGARHLPEPAMPPLRTPGQIKTGFGEPAWQQSVAPPANALPALQWATSQMPAAPAAPAAPANPPPERRPSAAPPLPERSVRPELGNDRKKRSRQPDLPLPERVGNKPVARPRPAEPSTVPLPLPPQPLQPLHPPQPPLPPFPPQPPQPQPQPLPQPQPQPPLQAAAASDAALLAQVSFVQQAQRSRRASSRWHRPGVRFFLTLMAVGMALLLAAQFLVQQRERLAIFHPGLRPVLQALCQPLACDIGPWRHLEGWIIDNSSFRRAGDDAFRLNAVLRNVAAVDLATPALELTLTDTQERTLVRRVVTPAELGADAVTPAAAEYSASLALTVLEPALAASISGYRLEIFYP